MPTRCCVPLCNNRGGHLFPSDKNVEKRQLRAAWIAAVRRVADKHGSKWIPKAYMVVCGDHFRPCDYLDSETYHGEWTSYILLYCLH